MRALHSLLHSEPNKYYFILWKKMGKQTDQTAHSKQLKRSITIWKDVWLVSRTPDSNKDVLTTANWSWEVK